MSKTAQIPRRPASSRPRSGGRALGDPHAGTLGSRFAGTFASLRQQVLRDSLQRAASALGVDLTACDAATFHAVEQLAAEA